MLSQLIEKMLSEQVLTHLLTHLLIHSLTHSLLTRIYPALLLLPRQFNETDVYLKIASLSYIGDPRMYVGGENPRKVLNLVLPKVPLYQQLYKKIFDKIAEKANVQLISGTHSPTYSLT